MTKKEFFLFCKSETSCIECHIKPGTLEREGERRKEKKWERSLVLCVPLEVAAAVDSAAADSVAVRRRVAVDVAVAAAAAAVAVAVVTTEG